MKRIIALLGLSIAMLTACTPSTEQTAPPIAFQIEASDEGVADFLALLGDHDTPYENDTCYNITPASVTDTYGFTVFKFNESCGSYLLHGDEVSLLDSGFGGLGVTSFALADIDANGSLELYFTFSGGSGVHRVGIGYADIESGEVKIFDYTLMNSNELLLQIEGESLVVYHAEATVDSFVDLTLTASERVGSIVLGDDGIVFEGVD